VRDVVKLTRERNKKYEHIDKNTKDHFLIIFNKSKDEVLFESEHFLGEAFDENPEFLADEKVVEETNTEVEVKVEKRKYNKKSN
jgi:hypothetical protein